MMCSQLDVSTSGYYAWRSRPISARRLEQMRLSALIQMIHTQSWGTYGVPRMHAELAAMGVSASPGRIERLMRSAGLQGVTRCKAKRTTRRARTPAWRRTWSTAASRPHEHINRLWVADFTYVWTDESWAYVAGIQHVCSRVICGYNVAERMTIDLVLTAFRSAQRRRRPDAV